MINSKLLRKSEILPESLQTEALHYVEFLIEKYAKSASPDSKPRKKRKAGLLEGKIHMSDDFDAPLEELQEYM
ncbi:MAG: DUF2281 domain-containing protein [Spirulinaceae cyanobacterium]